MGNSGNGYKWKMYARYWFFRCKTIADWQLAKTVCFISGITKRDKRDNRSKDKNVIDTDGNITDSEKEKLLALYKATDPKTGTANAGSCKQPEIRCPVTDQNVYRLEEIEVWSRLNGIKIRYDLNNFADAKDSHQDSEDHSLFSNEKARLIACEFFYKKAIQEISEAYFGLFLFLRTNERYADRIVLDMFYKEMLKNSRKLF